MANLLESVDTFHEPFDAIDPRWKSHWCAGLEQLAAKHRRLADASDPLIDRPGGDIDESRIDVLQQIVESLPATDVVTAIHLSRLTGYGILLCRLSELLSQHHAQNGDAMQKSLSRPLAERA
ncbi:hypothetical protein ACFFJT_17785 [Dyella flava]|uniref:hypothetical protein n=1 Tax=Dyella flava TaxID=1920170 RepID=UPI00195E8918|nr:hypothetical protein [Dyella flava]GLQ51785.1 hypothetical protein GCM10010872_32340 [Dyella flava]